MSTKFVDGGVTAAKGYKASGIHCGIRRNRTKRDLALVVSEVPAAAAGVYTQNLVKGAPLKVTKSHIDSGKGISAIICNSGIANTCNPDGEEKAETMSRLTAEALGLPPESIVVASTGVIGEPLRLEPIDKGLPELVAQLNEHGNEDAAEAIMTTDTKRKEAAVRFEIDGVRCHIGGMAKGSGMIHPNMATMLVFVTSDVSIAPELLQKALSEDVRTSFNMISIDGDTSTNDMVVLLANGLAGNRSIVSGDDPAYAVFCEALGAVTRKLCRMIAFDGEGATKLLECTVSGAKTQKDAAVSAKSVICSSLVKSAMFGADANWGRVLCAIGYSGADVDVEKIELYFRSEEGRICVCRNGRGVPFSEEEAKKILLCSKIEILVYLNDGEGEATAWGCDLTYDYVRINGDYRT